MGGILSSTPLDLVDLLFDFEGLEIIELGLVRLELGVEFVLAGFFLLSTSGMSRNSTIISQSPDPATHCFVTLEQDDSSTLVTCCQIVPRMVELDGRYDVGWLRVSRINFGWYRGFVPQGDVHTFRDILNVPLVSEAPGERATSATWVSQGPRLSGGGQQPGPGLSKWEAVCCPESKAAARIRTYWVNFHVGEPGSASTIVAGRGGVGEGRPSRYDGTLVERRRYVPAWGPGSSYKLGRWEGRLCGYSMQLLSRYGGVREMGGQGWGRC